jgi:two-component system, sensor histidine kinase and response regulator
MHEKSVTGACGVAHCPITTKTPSAFPSNTMIEYDQHPFEKKSRLLVVDDVYKNFEAMKIILCGEEFVIDHALSGQEAIEKATETPYDLILLDVMMPGMDGFEVCRELKKLESTRDTPIIFLTARTERDNIVRGFELGAVDYISKPFHPQELLVRLRTHLELKEKNRILKTINQMLEQKVAERTASLQEANTKLQRFEQAKTDFLMLVSHELRTPLHDLLGFASLVDESSVTPEQREYFTYIKTSTERLHRFIEASLLITSIRTDKYAMLFQRIRIAPLVEQCVRDAQESAAKKNLLLVTDFPDPQVKVLVDPELVSHCIRNILDNAVKASPEHGEVRLALSGTEDGVILDISDAGPGFSEEAMARLFSFFAKDDLLHHHAGLGLGLATAKLIMDAHDGQLSVIPIPEGGTTVRIGFPAEKDTDATR